jgi:hypothetical protein
MLKRRGQNYTMTEFFPKLLTRFRAGTVRAALVGKHANRQILIRHDDGGTVVNGGGVRAA